MKANEMNKVLFGIFVISIATSIPAHARNGTTTKAQVPAIEIPCSAVQGKKPWCACKSPLSSKKVDLSSLGTKESNRSSEFPNRKPRFVAKDKNGWYIAWSPCEDFDVFANEVLDPDAGSACKGVGFARFINTSVKLCKGYGSHNMSATFYSKGYDPRTAVEHYFIKFTLKSRNRFATINLKCTPGIKESFLQYNGDDGGTQTATFYSKCCCEGQCAHNKNISPPRKSEIGMIAGISVGGVVIAVIIVMIFFTKKYRCKLPYPIQEQGERQPLVRH